MKKQILVVEDDAAIAKSLSEGLGQSFGITIAKDGQRGYEMAKDSGFDLIILDLMLPEMNGMDVCKGLRRENVQTPILMLTSKSQEVDKVLGLELGADDYVTKPFSIRELTARINVLLRRNGELKKSVEKFSFDGFTVDFKKQIAFRDNNELKLTAKEFEILKYFVQHEGEVVTRDMLLDEVWGYESLPTTRTVDNYILSLRKSIEEDPAEPKHLLTVHTKGYRFVR